MDLPDTLNSFLTRLNQQHLKIGIIGMGYVGLPLALTFAAQKFHVVGFDTDPKKVRSLMAGNSYIKHIDSKRIGDAVEKKLFYSTDNFDRLSDCDAIIICVPTPLNANREPDISYIVNTAKNIAPHMRPVTNDRPPQLVVLESTTYPGTTEEVVKPILEQGKFKAGKDFFLAFSPEREDPGNKEFNTKTIPKVVGGHTEDCGHAAKCLYEWVIDTVVRVKGTREAEATKLLENIYRSVNIALVNELKMTFDKMGIDVWEVIRAAKTKPFGFTAFYPGPGWGGHCIPIDPYYLTWKAREYEMATRFIELAGEINTAMHHYVLEKVMLGLNRQCKSVRGSKILVLGVAYKKDIDDMRESPALPIMKNLLDLGATVQFYDPYVPVLSPTREYDFTSHDNFDINSLSNLESAKNFDAVVVITDHSCIEYNKLIDQVKLLIDARNVTNGHVSEKIVKA